MAQQNSVVLVIDDSRTMRLLMRKTLEDSQFEVYEAESGNHAIQIFPEVTHIPHHLSQVF